MVGVRGDHHQIVLVDALGLFNGLLLRIGDGGSKNLFHTLADHLVRVLENGKRIDGPLASDQIDHQPGFLR